MIAVKVDNESHARPQTGLNSADIVYVEQVEGGLTRYVAVYDSNHLPSGGLVGPVRSARQTDIPLLSPYGRVGLAYSGAISGLYPDLGAADLVSISPRTDYSLFSRRGPKPPPDNEYFDLTAAFGRNSTAGAQDVGFRFGPVPPGGAASSGTTVTFPAATYGFAWNGSGYTVRADGAVQSSTDQGPFEPNDVLVQNVRVVPGKYTDHNAGHPDNEVFSQTTGNGDGTLYRDGQAIPLKWSKAADTTPTTWTTASGEPLTLATGQVWVVMAPIPGSAS